jgi:hypothetical protein
MPPIERWLQNHILSVNKEVERAQRMLRKASPGMKPLAERALRDAEVRAAYALNWIKST